MNVRFSPLLVALALTACQKAAPGGSIPDSIAVTADEHGFTPSSVNLKAGSHTKLAFTRTTDDTCATKVVFPELKIEKDLPKNQAVMIDVPTDKPQTLTFQCGMGMYKSAVVINP